MTNRYPGACYRCGGWCKTGEGIMQQLLGKWRLVHKQACPAHAVRVHGKRLRQYERDAEMLVAQAKGRK